ncbi:METTL5 family protein [Methanopyrus sp. KOL6]|uniref:METTL5 family protein n=1 Tax=Methanopyrus sp. KOL6 TaxID=1937004 RepID=UPI000B4B643A|nr:METTL5 family protein [Methanopyrus sp. KOL6]
MIDRRLAMKLDELDGFPEPKLSLEQYETPGEVIRVLLSVAEREFGLECSRVLDLGAGTGRIGIGAALAGACEVTCVEVDSEAVKVARRNVKRAGVEDRLEVVEADVRDFEPEDQYDVTIMNPPFGAQRRGADRPFVEVALEASSGVVSLHRAGTEEFWKRRARELGATCDTVGLVRFPVPAMYPHHRSRIRHVDAAILVFKKID